MVCLSFMNYEYVLVEFVCQLRDVEYQKNKFDIA